MIFYFSATGNSSWVAKKLSMTFGEHLFSISDELKKKQERYSYYLQKGEKVFFVFPVHTWGPAVPVNRFIGRLNLQNYNGQAIYSICTCGSDCGHTDKIIKNSLKKQGLVLTACYSLSMPNTYILMKGFDTDSKEIVEKKLHDAPNGLCSIIESIKKGNIDKSLYHKSLFPVFKSTVLYSIFVRFVIGKNKFHTTNKCISCGLCTKVCPSETIKMINGKPNWRNTCIQCTACIHRCPVHAIEYGDITIKKGRYQHPELNIGNEML